MNTRHRLYVGTIGEGLFRSVDGGETFLRACNGMFVECHVRALVAHPRDDRLLYLGTEQGLFRSCDGADSWAQVHSPLDGRQIWSILVHPVNPDLMMVGTCPAHLFRTEDGGRTWTEPAAAIMQDCPRIMSTRVTTLRVDPVERQVLWCGVEIDGFYVSRDEGKTWKPIGHGLSSRDIHALALVADRGQTTRLIATTNNDVNVSVDQGDTWQPLRLGHSLPLPYFRGLMQLSGSPEILLLGTGDAPPGGTGLIARSTDGGASWNPTAMPGRANSTIWNFATHAADPQQLYASSVSGQVYRSVDGGLSWSKLPREFGEIRALAWTPCSDA